MASQPQFQATPIRLSVSYPQYKGNTNDYFMLGDKTPAIPFHTVIDTIQHGQKTEYGALALPGKEFIIKRTSGKTGRINDSEVHFKVATYYIVKNDWILLDILNNLNGRKLCSQSILYAPWSQLDEAFTKVDDNLYVF